MLLGQIQHSSPQFSSGDRLSPCHGHQSFLTPQFPLLEPNMVPCMRHTSSLLSRSITIHHIPPVVPLTADLIYQCPAAYAATFLPLEQRDLSVVLPHPTVTAPPPKTWLDRAKSGPNYHANAPLDTAKSQLLISTFPALPPTPSQTPAVYALHLKPPPHSTVPRMLSLPPRRFAPGCWKGRLAGVSQ